LTASSASTACRACPTEDDERRRSEPSEQRERKGPLGDETLHDAVAEDAAERRRGKRFDAPALQLPRAQELRGHGAPPECAEALPEARGRGIISGADARVMAANVLGEEVLVENRAEHRAAEQLHVRARTMDQLVSDDDGRIAGVDADEQHGDGCVEGQEAGLREHAREQQDVDELHRGDAVQHEIERPRGELR
jgi:hypothetical protein